MPLDDFYNKIVALSEFDEVQTVKDIINENSDLITEMRRQQLRAGESGDGQPTFASQGSGYTNYVLGLSCAKKSSPLA